VGDPTHCGFAAPLTTPVFSTSSTPEAAVLGLLCNWIGGLEVQMPKSIIIGLLVASLVLIGASTAGADDNTGVRPTPIVKQVAPETAKAGDVLTITGENLDKTRVKEFYLTTGTEDFKTAIVEQGSTEVKVTVPANVKTGRLHVMILTTGNPGQLLEQPVVLNIE
jgi:hypothetical protein